MMPSPGKTKDRVRGKFDWLHDAAKGGDVSLSQQSVKSHQHHRQHRILMGDSFFSSDGGPRNMSSTCGGTTMVVENAGQLLKDVEKYVATELNARGCNNNSLPSIARLQVYEEAMEKFLGKCGTYRSFLEAYRREQASLRAVYVERVAEIPRLRSRVEAAQAKANESADAAREAALLRANELRREASRLQTALTESEAARDKMAAELEKERATYKKVIEDADDLKRASTMLTSSLARLEEERERWVIQENSSRSEALNSRSTLDKANAEVERLKLLNAELYESLKTDRSEGVREHTAQVSELRSELATLTTAHRQLQIKYHTATTTQTQGVQEKLQLSNSKGILLLEEEVSRRRTGSFSSQHSGTPESVVEKKSTTPVSARARHQPEPTDPHFRNNGSNSSCNQSTSSNLERGASSLSKGMLVRTLTESNLNEDEIHDGDILSDPYVPPGGHFEGLGTSAEEVAIHLRFSGRIKNWRISKRETERMITDVWLAKEKKEKGFENDKREKLSPFLWTYLLERFKSQSLAIEWSYNLLDALRRYIADSDCRLFLDILNDELHEEVRIDQLQMLVDVLQSMAREDKASSSDGRTLTGFVTPLALMAGLSRLLPHKSDSARAKLSRQLQLETKAESPNLVNYSELIESDAQGNQGDFCELMREQHLQEIMQYTEHVALTIRASATQFASPEMPLARYRAALVKADPDKPRAEVNAYLVRGAQCRPKDVVNFELQSKPINAETFIKSLANSGLVKQSRPRQQKSAGGGAPGNTCVSY